MSSTLPPGEPLHASLPPRLILEINASERLAPAILHDEARVVVLLDRPGRREAAGLHYAAGPWVGSCASCTSSSLGRHCRNARSAAFVACEAMATATGRTAKLARKRRTGNRADVAAGGADDRDEHAVELSRLPCAGGTLIAGPASPGSPPVRLRGSGHHPVVLMRERRHHGRLSSKFLPPQTSLYNAMQAISEPGSESDMIPQNNCHLT
jgi:hypothetical protein